MCQLRDLRGCYVVYVVLNGMLLYTPRNGHDIPLSPHGSRNSHIPLHLAKIVLRGFYGTGWLYVYRCDYGMSIPSLDPASYKDTRLTLDINVKHKTSMLNFDWLKVKLCFANEPEILQHAALKLDYTKRKGDNFYIINNDNSLLLFPIRAFSVID